MKKTLLILTTLILISSANAILSDPPTPPIGSECFDITSIGISKGDILDNDKVLALFSSPEERTRDDDEDEELSYYCIKNILGLWDYDIYLEITDLNGKYVVLGDVLLVYGVYPGKIQESNILKQIDRNKLGVFEWVAPKYEPTSTFRCMEHLVENMSEPTCPVCTPGRTLDPCTHRPVSSCACIEPEYTLKVINNVIPDFEKHEIAKTFSKIVLIEIDGKLTPVRFTLGVWN